MADDVVEVRLPPLGPWSRNEHGGLLFSWVVRTEAEVVELGGSGEKAVVFRLGLIADQAHRDAIVAGKAKILPMQFRVEPREARLFASALEVAADMVEGKVRNLNA
jgi:hypothetical protein